MIYDLANWLVKQSQSTWQSLSRKKGLVKLILLPFILIIAGAFLVMGLICHIGAFMTHFENAVRGFFQFSKRGLTNSGMFGKLIYLPIFALACCVCVALMAVTLLQANPMRNS